VTGERDVVTAAPGTDDSQTATARREGLNDELRPRRLRVLNVAMSTPELRAGGAERAGLQLGDHLAAYVDVDNAKMAAAHDADLVTELELTGALVTVPSRTWLRGLWNRVHSSSENYSNTVVWPDLRGLDVGEYDLVHVHNSVPMAGMVRVALACKRRGVPYVVTTHEVSSISALPTSMEMSLLPRVAFEVAVHRPYWTVLRHARHLFALSEDDAARLRARLPGQSVSVVPNGVRLRPPAPDAADRVTERWGIPVDRRILLFVGQLSTSKGVGDLLAAYDALETECTLVVVGPVKEPAYRERLESYDDAHVRYLGYVGYPELGTLFQRADVFVFPTRSDVFPLVTLEAMAAGTAVVATTVGGIPDQLAGEAGVLVPPERPDRVAECVDQLLADDAYRASVAARGFERVEREYSWDGVARRVAETYETLCR
jgi:glycosyltransferase involved in cell wall biosynthesis